MTRDFDPDADLRWSETAQAWVTRGRHADPSRPVDTKVIAIIRGAIVTDDAILIIHRHRELG